MSEPVFEFHISRNARLLYDFNELLFSITGSVIFPNINAVRLFAQKINEHRTAGQNVPAGDLYGMGLLDEISHFIIETYRKTIDPHIFQRLEISLKKQIGHKKFDLLLETFASEFPASSVFKSEQSLMEYVNGKTGPLSNREIILEELLVLWLDNRNPAYRPIKEIIDEQILAKNVPYGKALAAMERFLDKEPPLLPGGLPLIQMLRLPAQKFPNSVTAQLEFIKERWGDLISGLLSRILISLDFIKEEQKARFDVGAFGPGPTHIIEFQAAEEEPERFSADLDWMPQLVLIAKSTYVWLDQLSKTYGRFVSRLDQIPDEELDRLAAYGFTGLWLIGLWERSKASRKIKQISGNPEAVASAYSLYDYTIAADLGGEEAYQNLKKRAGQRGIRLASDMVPNHMAIDSRWVVEHPHWFIQSDFSPFPAYHFNGPDLSEDTRMQIFIEDGYWNKTDAAVVFKRVDRQSGDTKYIYHGNDGTSMPWNDTAQLNYLLPEVREAVIQTILHVARKFPIIRFDAAMTLAKKHFQRLWFPQPGTGGDIPSRAEHGMSKKLFDQHFPKEFWREVVDRVKREVPDTLLLAEAFWMMEGYFVRTLGMHRVYNSAFMNMLKNEENAKYRRSIKNVLEFNPQILKRYVNFMNNPDEETAVTQFGKDDKYFGVCILMVTMPGLPMFGHGQIEGLAEKYGMEYRRAYWDEKPDSALIERHRREIFPLLKKRFLFSDVENFYLFDFFNSNGTVNENVFAYSNRAGEERALIFYNNIYEKAAGWIRTSAAYLEHNRLRIKDLTQALHLSAEAGRYVILYDAVEGLEYLRSCAELTQKGLYVELGAFKYQVFLNIREVRHSAEKPYAKLERFLNGRGVPSVEEALQDYFFRPILNALREAVNPGSLNWLRKGFNRQAENEKVLSSFKDKLNRLLTEISTFEEIEPLSDMQFQELYSDYLNLLRLPFLKSKSLTKNIPARIRLLLPEEENEKLDGWRIALCLPFLNALRLLYQNREEFRFNITFLNSRPFTRLLQNQFKTIGLSDRQAAAETELLKILTAFPQGLPLNGEISLMPFFDELLTLPESSRFLGFNWFNHILYFNKEAFETLLSWLFLLSLLQGVKKKRLPVGKLNALCKKLEHLFILAKQTDYEWDAFTAGLNK